jgi:ketosteroid isomerase-like protein
LSVLAVHTDVRAVVHQAAVFAQRAEIEAVNAKWVDFFDKGDFAGVASLYTEDATAFPPGAGMMKGRAAKAMWKGAASKSAIRNS